MAAPDWWTQRRFGMLVNTNLAAVPAWSPIGEYASWYRAHNDFDVSDVLLHPTPMVETLAHHRDRWAHVEDFDDFLPFLTFDKFDPDVWAGLARDSGMGYSVIVAKHHDGLCWWDAPNTDRTVLHGGPRRNVLAEYAAACERADLVFGTQYSLLDWSDDRYPSCSYVDEVVHPQVLDLVDRYGSKMLWADGHWGAGGAHWRSDDLIAAARAYDSEIAIDDRWWSEHKGVRSYEYQIPDEIVEHEWELRRGLGSSFGYNRAERDEHLLSADKIVALLTEVVAKGGHLLLSVGPDASGQIPEIAVKRLRLAGTWVRQHQRLIDTGKPWIEWGDDLCRYLVVDDQLHIIDIAGQGRFAEVTPGRGRVTSVTTVDGDSIGFEQTEDGLLLSLRGPGAGSQPTVYRIGADAPPPPPIELFPAVPNPPIVLADVIGDAMPGDIVQLGEGTYIGPARIPPGVTVRGLGPDRTVIDGLESVAVTIASSARLEHCAVGGGRDRIVWLPSVVVHLTGDSATMLGCNVSGHAEVVAADDVKITSCTLNGIIGKSSDRLSVHRSRFEGMQWDCAVDITGGSGHLVESCKFSNHLQAIRCTEVVASVIRGNRIQARWWGVQLVDSENCTVAANAIESTMRAVDIDGGSDAEVVGNAVLDGDSGCVVQRGAIGTEVAGNRWERCRVGLLAWDAGPLRHSDNAAVDLGDEGAATVVGP